MPRKQSNADAGGLKPHGGQRRSFLKRLGVGIGAFALSGASYAGVATADNNTEEARKVEIPASEAKEHPIEINALKNLNDKNWAETTESTSGNYVVQMDPTELPKLSHGEKVRAKNSKQNVKRKLEKREQKAMKEFRRNTTNDGGNGRGHDIGNGKGHDKGNGKGHN